MIVKHKDYIIKITYEKIEGDYYYVSRVSEFPDLEDYGSSYNEALELMIDSIDTTISIFNEKHK